MKGKIRAALPKDHGLVADNDHESVMVIAYLAPIAVGGPIGEEPTVTYKIGRVERVGLEEGGALLTQATDARHGRLSLLFPEGEETGE